MSNNYVYAETAFHHEGDYHYLVKLVEAAADSGAHGIKFQCLLDLSNFASSFHPGYGFLQSCILSADQWLAIVSHAQDKELDVIWMPLDTGAVELMKQFRKPPVYQEIHSVSFYDQSLLESIRRSGVPLIISAGGRTLEELKSMQEFFGEQFQVLMTGFQAFPSRLSDVKLLRIPEYKKIFPALRIGYADHSAWNDEMAIRSNEYACILGAEIFEKHLAIEPGVERTDWQSAVSAETLEEIIRRLNDISENVLNVSGSTLFEMTGPELNYRNRQKVPVASRKIEKGMTVTEEDLVLKMTGDPACIQERHEILGKKLLQAMEKDAPFYKSYFQ